MKKLILSMLILGLSAPACHARDYWSIGTRGTSGWRTHEDNILFTVEKKPGKGTFTLHLNLVDSDPKGSVVKVTVNGRELNTFSFPAAELLRGGSLDIEMGDKSNYNWGIGQ